MQKVLLTIFLILKAESDVSKMIYTINAAPFQCVPGVKLIDLFCIYIHLLMGHSLTVAAVKATNTV